MADTAVATRAPAAGASTKPKVPKSQKPTAAGAGTKKTRAPRAYPSFYEMVSVAIAALKERTGSSQYAIAKFIEEKHNNNLPPNFKKLLLLQLKRLVAAGKLVKVKNSFKLPPAPAKKAADSSKAKIPAKKPKAVKAKTAGKPKAKGNAAVRPKPEAVDKPAKVARTAARTSPGKKAAPVKKIVKKPKTVKSPARKRATAKK